MKTRYSRLKSGSALVLFVLYFLVMNRRLYRYSLLILLLASACAKPQGFQVSDYDFTRVDQAYLQDEQGSDLSDGARIIRGSNRIELIPLSSNWENEHLLLIVDARIGNASFQRLKFQGKKTGIRATLYTENEKLKDRLIVQVTCLSDQEACLEFFIEAFLHNNGTIYQDQFLSQKKNGQQTNESQPRIDPDQPKDNDGEIFDDEALDEDATKKSGYMGASNDEIRDLFGKTEPSDRKTFPKRQLSPSKLAVLQKFENRGKAIGAPSDPDARLIDGIDFHELAGLADFRFQIKDPTKQEHFGAYSLALLIAHMDESLKSSPGKPSLFITGISKRSGGPLSYRIGNRTFLHNSHRNGLDADVRYFRSSENYPSDVVISNSQLNPHFLAKQQWELFKASFGTGFAEIIFVAPLVKKALCEEARKSTQGKSKNDQSQESKVLKRILPIPGHESHFHLRAKCLGSTCKRLIYKKTSTDGCPN